MRRAYCLLRDKPHYRIDAFCAGLEKAGFAVQRTQPADCKKGDVLVIWNRYGTGELLADKWDRAGCDVIVCENGYIGEDDLNRQYYAIALKGHNGSGKWHIGGPERWEKLNIEIQPWQRVGAHILICAQRGIGSRKMASPMDWHKDMAVRLEKITQRPIKIRNHPEGKELPPGPLADDLENAWAVVVWSSTTAVKALIAGIPVFYDAPHMIVSAAAQRIQFIETPSYPDRLKPFQDMAWAQWNIEEIGQGLPFKYLLKNETDILLSA